MVLSVHSSRSGWLFQADTWYPGWQAFLDHHPVPLLRAEDVFRGVELPPGEHLLEFVYRPNSFFLGAVLTCLVIVSLGVVLFKERWQRRAE